MKNHVSFRIWLQQHVSKTWTKISWRNKTGYKKEQCLQIVELFQKTVLQCSSVVKTHSSPTVHNLTKNLKKPGEISACEGWDWKSILDARDLLTLRWHCIKNNHDFVLEMHALRNTKRSHAVHRVIHKCKLKLVHAKDPYTNMIRKHCCLLWTKAHLKWMKETKQENNINS